jgi:hypothetical protein
VEENREFEQGGMSLAENLQEYAEQLMDSFSSDVEYTQGRGLSWLERRSEMHAALAELLEQYPLYALQEGEFITEGEGNDYFAANNVDYDPDGQWDNVEPKEDVEVALYRRGWSPQIDSVRHGLDDPWVYWITRAANPNSEEDGIDEFVYLTREFKTSDELIEWLNEQPITNPEVN